MSDTEATTIYNSLQEHFHLTDDYLKKPVGEKHLEELASFLNLEWKRLLACLGLEQGITDDIDRDLKESEKRHHSLLKWKDIMGANATYDQLIFALIKMKCVQDAESVCRLIVQNLYSGMLSHRAKFYSFRLEWFIQILYASR